jgi:hypothetical protein
MCRHRDDGDSDVVINESKRTCTIGRYPVAAEIGHLFVRQPRTNNEYRQQEKQPRSFMPLTDPSECNTSLVKEVSVN